MKMSRMFLYLSLAMAFILSCSFMVTFGVIVYKLLGVLK